MSSSSSCNDHSKAKTKQEQQRILYYKCEIDTTSPNTVIITRIPITTAATAPPPTPSSPPAATNPLPPQEPLPESVLQYQRQLRKVQASNRATNTSLTPSQHLKILHSDEYLVITNKPSGVLCVPGVHDHPSLLSLVHQKFGFTQKEEEVLPGKRYKKKQKKEKKVSMNNMIVHRLDMDTSGIVVFGLNNLVVKSLHELFRTRKVTKKYEALLCGHLPPHMSKGTIQMPLQRDHRHPPFMRISTPKSETEAEEAVKDLQHAGYKKLIMKQPKDSVTEFKVLSREWLCVDEKDGSISNRVVEEDGEIERTGGGDGREKDGCFPVTRVELVPVTGRTHQLRVHCAAIGHPIVADPAYGIWGEASPNGGFDESDMSIMFPHRANLDLQRAIDAAVRPSSSSTLLTGDNIVDKEHKDATNKEEDCEGKDNNDNDAMCMCLHARELRFDHPVTGEDLLVEAPPSF